MSGPKGNILVHLVNIFVVGVLDTVSRRGFMASFSSAGGKKIVVSEESTQRASKLLFNGNDSETRRRVRRWFQDAES